MKTENLSIWRSGLATSSAPYIGKGNVADVVVIGAGLTGLSAAYHLLIESPGRKVIVLEAGNIGAGASGRSTGMLTPGVGQNLPGLIKRYGEATARALYKETLNAVQYAKELVSKENIACHLRMTGQLIIPRGMGGGRRIEQQASAYDQLQLPYNILDESELYERAKFAVSPEPVSQQIAALRLPNAGTLHPDLLIRGLADRIRELGGDIYEHSAVTNIGSGPQPIVSVNGDSSIVTSDVVMAVSGFSAMNRLFVGRVLPVQLNALASRPLLPQQLDALGWSERECIIDSRRLFNYFRLTEDNRIVFGGGLPVYRWAGRSYEMKKEISSPARLEREFQYVFGGVDDIEIECAWQGVIGYVLNTMPIVRRLASNPALIFAGAWSGHGIALSIRSGKWIKHLVDEKTAPNELPWFSDSPPYIPFEPVRWASFLIATRAMALLDNFSFTKNKKQKIPQLS